MKHLLVRACSLALFVVLFASAWNTLSAQNLRPKASPSLIDGVSQPKVTKTFVTDLDVAQIDIVKGPVDYQLFTNTKADPNNWTLVDFKSVAEPTDLSLAADVVLKQPDSYQMKLTLTADCDGCVTVVFKAN